MGSLIRFEHGSATRDSVQTLPAVNTPDHSTLCDKGRRDQRKGEDALPPMRPIGTQTDSPCAGRWTITRCDDRSDNKLATPRPHKTPLSALWYNLDQEDVPMEPRTDLELARDLLQRL